MLSIHDAVSADEFAGNGGPPPRDNYRGEVAPGQLAAWPEKPRDWNTEVIVAALRCAGTFSLVMERLRNARITNILLGDPNGLRRRLVAISYRLEFGSEHWARYIEAIGIDALTETTGATPLHTAAGNGSYAQLPACFQTEAFATLGAGERETPLHVAARLGQLKPFPRHLLTPNTLLAKDHRGDTALHYAARRAELSHIPTGALSPEMLLVQNNAGDNPAHRAAAISRFHKIPARLVTPGLLESQNADGATPIFILAGRRKFGHIPTHMLTPEVLTTALRSATNYSCRQAYSSDSVGWAPTPMHRYAFYGKLRLLPKRLLTTQTLDVQTTAEYTPRQLDERRRSQK